MQNLNDKFGEHSSIQDSNFLDWEDELFGENVHLSDVENVFGSKNLIQNLHITNNSSHDSLSLLCKDNSVQGPKVMASAWKEIKLPKMCKVVNVTDKISQKGDNKMNVSIQKTVKLNSRKRSDEHSDSDDFYSPNKKRKKSKTHSINIFSNSDKDLTAAIIPINSITTYQNLKTSLEKSKSQSDTMVFSSQATLRSQIAIILNEINDNSELTPLSQETCSSQKNSTLSQEISTSQKMSIASSQEMSNSQKMNISSQETCSSQKMSISSQENSSNLIKMNLSNQEFSVNQKINNNSGHQYFVRQESCNPRKITSSQESSAYENTVDSQKSYSPKRDPSSQESLRNKVINISIEDDSDILNTHSQKYCIVTPRGSHSQILSREDVKSPESNQTSNLKKLKGSKLQAFNNISMKLDLPDIKKISENLSSPVSDSFCNKRCRQYDKKEKWWISTIRKRELRLTKRENVIEIREKLLAAREAEIQKKEYILKAKEQRYLRCKLNMKRIIHKQTISSIKLKRRAGVLEDETNACNKFLPLKVFK